MDERGKGRTIRYETMWVNRPSGSQAVFVPFQWWRPRPGTLSTPRTPLWRKHLRNKNHTASFELFFLFLGSPHLMFSDWFHIRSWVCGGGFCPAERQTSVGESCVYVTHWRVTLTAMFELRSTQPLASALSPYSHMALTRPAVSEEKRGPMFTFEWSFWNQIYLELFCHKEDERFSIKSLHLFIFSFQLVRSPWTVFMTKQKSNENLESRWKNFSALKSWQIKIFNASSIR